MLKHERHSSRIDFFEHLIRRDPARRGLIGGDGAGPGRGELLSAAATFADRTTTGVCLITGFFIPTSAAETHEDAGTVQTTPAGAAETDGPPGAAMLARLLQDLEIPVTVVTDPLCEQVVARALKAVEADAAKVICCPEKEEDHHEWLENHLDSPDGSLVASHFIAIERVGPGHTPESLASSDPHAEILNRSSAGTTKHTLSGRCVNMRGESIDEFSFGLHHLFEEIAARRPNATTIGIGDGGNEIGMGRFTWSEIRSRLSGERADQIPCRIATQHTIVAGISNWGAYALAASIALLRNRVDLIDRHTEESQRHLLEKIVSESGAVDGVTGRREATVDGVPFLTGIQPWSAIRRELGLQ